MDKNIKIFVMVIVLLVVGVIGTALVRTNATPPGPGKYDTFTQCLKDKGATFFGAFWCPHCQEQEKWLDASRSALEKKGLYVECSNLDAQSQTQVCIDKKIESYPTWEFANTFTVESATGLHKCTDSPDESTACKNAYRPDRNTWILDSTPVIAAVDPTHIGTKWTFPALSRTSGEVPIETLAKISSCPLLADETSTTLTPPVTTPSGSSPVAQ